MNIHEFAAMMNMREIGSEITPDEEKQAKELGYVVVFGASDDLCEFRGAIDDEAGACNGADVYLLDTNIMGKSDCNCEFAEKWFEHLKQRALRLEAIWCPDDGSGASWGYKLHDNREVATFDIMEGNELYCRGIVFSLTQVQQSLMPADQIAASLAARIGPDYGISLEIAISFVRKTLEIYREEYASRDAKSADANDEYKRA